MGGKSTPSIPPAPAPAQMPFTPESEQKAGSKRARTVGQEKLKRKQGLRGTILTNPLGSLGGTLSMLGQ